MLIQVIPPVHYSVCMCVSVLGQPDLASKNTEHPVKPEFQKKQIKFIMCKIIYCLSEIQI